MAKRKRRAFTKALGLRPIRAAEPGLEAPVLGERAEGRVPDDAPLPGVLADRPGPVVEMLAGVAVRNARKLARGHRGTAAVSLGQVW